MLYSRELDEDINVHLMVLNKIPVLVWNSTRIFSVSYKVECALSFYFCCDNPSQWRLTNTTCSAAVERGDKFIMRSQQAAQFVGSTEQ